MSAKTAAETMSQIGFYHITTPAIHIDRWGKARTRNGCTAAYQVITKPDGSRLMLMGVAVCGENDMFLKKMGRVIAEGRMKKKPYTLEIDAKERPSEVAREVLNEVYFTDMADQSMELDGAPDAQFELTEA